MSKTIFLVSLILIVLQSNLHFTSALQEIVDDFDTSKVMVGFNPYVSVLDEYNYSRYGIDELIPFFAKLATRFKKVHVQLGINEHNNEAGIDDQYGSLVQSPLAAAKYNCLSTTKNKIEIFLEIDHFNKACHCQKNKIYQMLHPFLILAQKANLACNGTVSTILVGAARRRFFGRYCSGYSCSLPKYTGIALRDTFKLLPKFVMGVSVSFHDYCNGDVSDLGEHFNVSALIVYFRNYNEYFKQSSTNCTFYNYNKSAISSFQMIKALILTNDDRFVNMSTEVSTWKNIITYPSDIYYFALAFEPHNNHLYYGYGWWILTKDPGSVNTSEFVFEEKVRVADKMDHEDDPRNYKWLKKEYTFNENTTAIVSFEPKNFESSIYYNFCRIIALEGYNISELGSILKTTEQRFDIKACENSRNVYILSSYYLPGNYMSFEIKVAVYKITEAKTTLVHGYAYPLEKCSKFTDPDEDFTNMLDQLQSPRSTVFLFYFHEEQTSIEVGTKRLVLERTVLFEKCKEIIRNSGSGDVEIAFVSLGYFLVDNFYSSAKAMQEYVKYVYMLNDWVGKQNNIVLCIGLLEDRQLSFGTYGDIQSYVGFYTYNAYTNVYTTKSQQALELSQSLFPELIYNSTNNFETTVGGLNTTQYVIIFCTLGLISAICSLIVTYIVRRKNKSNLFTTIELDEFFNGELSSDNEAQKLSYDKEKYEICKEKFTVDLNSVLGKGEFGVVYRGTIDTEPSEIQVAVKTSNPEKTQKTQLTGLLSEIKVLAYIGKHANIIELLGANSEDLEKAKVFIFLEFCHLGSLKKMLTDIRLPLSSPLVDTTTNVSGYKNVTADNRIILDTALSEDMYRWSMDICNGMAFLAEKHVVHADLAIRNVLLNLRREAKICDFGLSRRMYNYTNYVKTKQEPLPWKYMAPEALRDMQFNEKTDVWAFGVTLWEIYSLGSTPFAGLSWDPNFSQILERGLRLSKPEYCERDMFSKMKLCWNLCPELRPTFSEILSMIQSSDDNY